MALAFDKSLTDAEAGIAFVAVGPTEVIAEVLSGPHQHDMHCRTWRWHLHTRGNAAREAAVRAELRQMIEDRRSSADRLHPYIREVA